MVVVTVAVARGLERWRVRVRFDERRGRVIRLGKRRRPLMFKIRKITFD